MEYNVFLSGGADKKPTPFQQVTGIRTPRLFAQLPKETRARLFRRHLVQVDEIYFNALLDHDFDGTDDSMGVRSALLRCKRFMGDDELGEQLREEARQIYFGENTFRIKYPSLTSFLEDDTRLELGDIENMLKTVIVDIAADHFLVRRRPISGAEHETRTRGITSLTRLRNATSVTIEVSGDGALDGCDSKTQTTILAMSRYIQEVIDHFGDRLIVDRKHTPTGARLDIKHFWDKPTPEEIRNVEIGIAPFWELMRVQIDNLRHPGQ